MMNKLRVLIIANCFICSFITCSQPSNRFTNTKWVFTMLGCSNYFYFDSDSTYKKYTGCELEDTLYGNYFFEHDTLYLEQQGSVHDSLYTIGSPHYVGKVKYKLLVTNNMLKHISLEDYNYIKKQWVTSNFKFDNNYIYIKER